MTQKTSAIKVFSIGVAAIALGACSGLNDTQQSTLSGGAIGAAAGAAGTAVTGGCVSCGAALGGAAGAGAGFLSESLDED